MKLYSPRGAELPDIYIEWYWQVMDEMLLEWEIEAFQSLAAVGRNW